MYIESNQNQKIKNWSKLRQKKYRNLEGLFLVEGEHLVGEALKAGVAAEVLLREGSGLDVEPGVPVYTIKAHVFNKLAAAESPQGVMAVCQMTEQALAARNRLLLLDGIQDPGNLGTLVRSAAAFGFEGIVLGEGCVDLYNEKTIRSTQGALFSITIVKGDLGSWVPALQADGVAVYGTALENATPLQEVQTSQRMAFILGSEGTGVQGKHLALTDGNIFIEINPKVESLNVSIAGSVLMHHFKPY